MVLVPTAPQAGNSLAPACGAVLVLWEPEAQPCATYTCMLFKDCLPGECRAQFAGSACLAGSVGSYLPPDTHCPAQFCGEHCATQCGNHKTRSAFLQISGRALCTWTLDEQAVVVEQSKQQLETHALSEGKWADNRLLPTGTWAASCDKRYLHGVLANAPAPHCDHGLCYSCGTYLALLGLHRCSKHNAWSGHVALGTRQPGVDDVSPLLHQPQNVLSLSSEAPTVETAGVSEAYEADDGDRQYEHGSDYGGSYEWSGHDHGLDVSPGGSVVSSSSAQIAASSESASSSRMPDLLPTASGSTAMASSSTLPISDVESSVGGWERPPPLSYAQVYGIIIN